MKYVSYFVALNHKNYNWLWTRLAAGHMNILSGSQEQSEEALYMETNSAAEGSSQRILQLPLAWCLFMVPRYTATTTTTTTLTRGGTTATATTATMQWKWRLKVAKASQRAGPKCYCKIMRRRQRPGVFMAPSARRTERVDELGAPQSGDNALCRSQ